jgi:hypothetical protein
MVNIVDHHQPQRIFHGIFRKDHDQFPGHCMTDPAKTDRRGSLRDSCYLHNPLLQNLWIPGFFRGVPTIFGQDPNGDSENQERKDRLGIKERPIYPRRQDRPVCGAGKSDNDEQDCMPTTPAAVITDARKHMSPVFYKKI